MLYTFSFFPFINFSLFLFSFSSFWCHFGVIISVFVLTFSVVTILSSFSIYVFVIFVINFFVSICFSIFFFSPLFLLSIFIFKNLICLERLFIFFILIFFAQSAEDPDSIDAEGSYEYLGYDTKQSDDEVPVILEFWGMRCTPS